MTKLLLLVKVSLQNQFGWNRLQGGRPLWQTLLLAGTILVVIGLGISPLIRLFWENAGVLRALGLLDLLLLQAILMPSVLCLFTGIYSAPGQLFMCADYELLLSLPVRTSTVLMSKFANLLLSSIVFTMLLAMPLLIIYGLRSGAGPLFYVLAALSLPFVPLIPLTAATVITAFTARAAARFKRSNAILTNLTLGLIAGLLPAWFAISNSNPTFLTSLNQVLQPVKRWYPPAGFYFEALQSSSVTVFALFIAVSVGVFVLFTMILARYFKSIHSRLNASWAAANYRLQELGTSTVMRALFMKELKGYLSCPIYVMNTFFGMVTLVGFAVVMLIGGPAIKAKLQFAPTFSWDHSAPMIGLVVAIFTSVITCTTAVTISIEGRSLWILKSAPLGPLTIFRAKLLLNLAATLPFIALTSVLLAIAFRLNFGHWLLILALPSIYAMFMATAGLLLNLRFPKLEFKSATAVVKQSSSALLSLVVGFGSFAVPIAIYNAYFSSTIAYEYYAVGVGVTLLILTAWLWQALKTKGVAQFERL